MFMRCEIANRVATLGFDRDNRIMSHAIQRATNLSPSKIREFGVVSFVYAGLFLTGGIGLWLIKRWASGSPL